MSFRFFEFKVFQNTFFKHIDLLLGHDVFVALEMGLSCSAKDKGKFLLWYHEPDAQSIEQFASDSYKYMKSEFVAIVEAMEQSNSPLFKKSEKGKKYNYRQMLQFKARMNTLIEATFNKETDVKLSNHLTVGMLRAVFPSIDTNKIFSIPQKIFDDHVTRSSK